MPLFSYYYNWTHYNDLAHNECPKALIYSNCWFGKFWKYEKTAKHPCYFVVADMKPDLLGWRV